MKLFCSSSDKLFSSSYWGLPVQGLNGEGTVAAILDTGTCNHAALPLYTNKILTEFSWNFTSNPPDKNIIDVDGHGCRSAGILAGLGYQDAFDVNDPTAKGEFPGGIAPAAQLIICRTAVDAANFSLQACINALDWLIQIQQDGKCKVDVVSMPFGTAGYNKELEDRIRILNQNHSTICIAAGSNSGRKLPEDESILYPARFGDVICVGAHDFHGNRALFSPKGAQMEFLAPGKCIGAPAHVYTHALSCGDGTSSAAPAIAGLVCLLIQMAKQAGPPFSELISRVEIIRTLLIEMSTEKSHSSEYGYGPLNPSKWLKKQLELEFKELKLTIRGKTGELVYPLSTNSTSHPQAATGLVYPLRVPPTSHPQVAAGPAYPPRVPPTSHPQVAAGPAYPTRVPPTLHPQVAAGPAYPPRVPPTSHPQVAAGPAYPPRVPPTSHPPVAAGPAYPPRVPPTSHPQVAAGPAYPTRVPPTSHPQVATGPQHPPLHTLHYIALPQAPTTLNSSHHLPIQRHPLPPPYTPAPQMHAIDQYAKYLRTYYCAAKLPVYSKWSPTLCEKYIHLTVVKKTKVSKAEADRFTRATLHGNIDDIIKVKKPLEFSGIGKTEDGSLAKFILVEGGPGIGKTTFAWKLCRKWSNGEILQWFRLVILLKLRDKRVREAKSIFDLLYYSDDELRTEIAREVTRSNGESVFLLFEGFDELPEKLQRQGSIFLDILYRQCLPEATVLITSRPSASQFLYCKFLRKNDQHIEILGFTKADVQCYIRSATQDEQIRTEFSQYLKCYTHIRGLMYVPLNAVIVTEIYKSTKLDKFEDIVPSTLTELYTSLTRGMLLRYLMSHNEYGKQEWRLRSFSDLPEELYNQFDKICEIAFQGIVSDEFIFDDLGHDFNTLDLMQGAAELYVGEGAVVSFNFFHTTLQEFLAAVHVSKLPLQEQVEYYIKSTQGDHESDVSSEERGHESDVASEQDLESDVASEQGDLESDVASEQGDCESDVASEHELDGTSEQGDRESDVTSGSDMLLEQSGLSKFNVVVTSSHFQNVLRFTAGLTKLKNIPLGSIVIEDEGGEQRITLNSLHWLFEAQCISAYDKATKAIATLKFFRWCPNMNPFDCFVLGFALSHINVHGTLT